ncbi:MAG: bifunctional diaminohydroxyphosphoribosylaminopyrimidine deaminase/5-amino-6-(5-phosphoribosylamino)uracil reductase RibD [Fimbriimonadaceae bacterium]|jgi:diaminohydroxyphosphoribosylaminopyrimidine deaminase/5-amino-6-(5-phosphoribosylamino)uracil reductase|nr:bifunctional diaminohydroxyphosphoribosylaminopyrimidine deaminase/5-amino-6-(5-phosphoribosylamino)uracil reductase RibD [Fimbriimonadaceae bacterium]
MTNEGKTIHKPEEAMALAIELSQNGFPAPNPRVGCVIVNKGKVVGQGYHAYTGGAHAEIVALQEAGELARGATAFVTLEPCNHTGRTGPCTTALTQAGVAEVVFAVNDPNPVAAGGSEVLAQAGVSVSSGLLGQEAREANRIWLTAQEKGRPFVIVKAAITLDGRIAWPDGSSRWITGEEARAAAHFLRGETAAILVGWRTIAVDDPMLTARRDGVVNQPLRVVLDPDKRLSGEEEVFRQPGETLWLGDSIPSPKRTLLPNLKPKTILAELWNRGVTSLLVEGGGVTIRNFVESGLVDELHLFLAPRLFGDGTRWLGPGDAWGPEGIDLELLQTEKVGRDLWLTYRYLGKREI